MTSFSLCYNNYHVRRNNVKHGQNKDVRSKVSVSGLYYATQLLYEVQTPSRYITMVSIVCVMKAYASPYPVQLVACFYM